MGFAHPEYWIATAALLPVILLYLLRPRPRDIDVPSLMFVARMESQRRRFADFLQKLVRDPLLLIQALLILLLVTALLSPFYLAQASAEKTVIVLDVSASMQAVDVTPSRFDAALKTAEKYAEGSVSIVVAESTPFVVIRDGDEGEARRVLSKLKPGGTQTNLGDALILAEELLGDGGRIVLISDFASNTGTPLQAAEKLVQRSGTQVIYEPIRGEGGNLGIIQAVMHSQSLDLLVKNYQADAKKVSITIDSKGERRMEHLTLPPRGTGFLSLPSPESGITEIQLPPDALEVDNHVYISVPEHRTRRVLLVSDDPSAPTPLYLALTSLPDVKVERVFFETMPREFNYDLVLLDNYTRNSPLPGSFQDLRRYVEAGGNLVILYSSDLPLMDTNDLLPVHPLGVVNRDARLLPASTSPVVKDIDFGSVHTYLDAELLKDATLLVESQEGTPIIAYRRIGKGHSIFAGLNEHIGVFHLQPDYPIFWLKLLDWVSRREDVKAYNYQSGATLYLSSEQRVKTPTRDLTTKNLLLDETGVYQVGDKKIAVNLLDEKESNITASLPVRQTSAQDVVDRDVSRQSDLRWLPLMAALLMLLLEIKILSLRGEV